ncbi:COG1032 Fe-S oxidoreductase [Candidatus Pelagibacterales bacterium]
MAKILFINPNKWGRGITPIWVASHSAILKQNDHKVELFDCTFYKEWTDNELSFNTKNNQYQYSEYFNKVQFLSNSIKTDLQKKIDEFKPDIIFWSALSSHIHGEGEYVNVEHGYSLINDCTLNNCLLITGGLQVTASPENVVKKFKKVDFFIGGESEFVLTQIADNISNKKKIEMLNGIFYKNINGELKINQRQKIISDLNEIPIYDYSLFEKKIFLRPYNGQILNAIDYELSRGCIYTCTYCVETVIQNYYNFNDKTPRGALVGAKNYLRNKTAERVYAELSLYKNKFNIELVRCQDTNFLTINQKLLKEFEKMNLTKPLGLKLYIETRPEGINEKSVKLLKNIGVDGVGMGVELAGTDFREKNLNRFVNEDKIINAFKLLKENGIKRTSYNIIGLPGQNEESVIDTIKFNRKLKPDNVTCAFYTPYQGTAEQRKSVEMNYFSENENNLDNQLRSASKGNDIPLEKLNYYKKNFVSLVRAK